MTLAAGPYIIYASAALLSLVQPASMLLFLPLLALSCLLFLLFDFCLPLFLCRSSSFALGTHILLGCAAVAAGDKSDTCPRGAATPTSSRSWRRACPSESRRHPSKPRTSLRVGGSSPRVAARIYACSVSCYRGFFFNSSVVCVCIYSRSCRYDAAGRICT